MLQYYSKINYPFPDGNALKYLQVTDILTRVNLYLSEEDKEKYLATYSLDNGERPEDVSFSLYGDTKLFWTVLYANEMHDYIAEWYKTEEQIYEYALQKYGEDNLDEIHSIIDEYNNVVGSVFNKTGTYVGDAVTDIITITSAGHRYTTVDNVYLHFTSGNGETGTYNVYQVINDNIFTVQAVLPSNTSGSVICTKIAADAVWMYDDIDVMAPSYTFDVRGITNYEYELIENEKKRIINVIRPDYIESFVSKFRERVKYARF